MTESLTVKASPKEQAAQAALQPFLLPGETLLAFAQGKLVAGIWSNTEYFYGLTEQGLLLVPKGKRSACCRAGLPCIEGVQQPKGTPRLVIQLRVPGGANTEKITLSTADKAWTASMRALGEQLQALAAAQPLPTLTIQQSLEQAGQLRELGFLKTARAIIKARTDASPAYLAEPQVASTLRQISDDLLGMRVGAVMYGLVVVALLLLALNGQAQIGFGIIIAILAIIELARGSSMARGTALGLAVLTAVFNVILNITASSPIDVVAWIFFAGAMVLVLWKNPTRLRIALGGALFLFGVVGLFAFVFVSAMFFPSVLDAVVPPQPFQDDFSQNTGWMEDQGGTYSAGREDGAYAISLNEASLNYYALPPLSYFPEQAEVEVWVPQDYLDPAMGMFGLVCRFQQNGDKFYAVVFDQSYDEYAVFHFEGDSAYTLTDPAWLPAGGLHAPGEKDRVGVTCAEDAITVSINGTAQPPISEDGMAAFGSGSMGFLAFTSDPIPAQGYKVMFDNASFSPPAK